MQLYFQAHVFFFINIVCVKHKTTDMFENVSCFLSRCGKWSLKLFLSFAVCVYVYVCERVRIHTYMYVYVYIKWLLCPSIVP